MMIIDDVRKQRWPSQRPRIIEHDGAAHASAGVRTPCRRAKSRNHGDGAQPKARQTFSQADCLSFRVGSQSSQAYAWAMPFMPLPGKYANP